MKDILKIFIVEENKETALLIKQLLTKLDQLCLLVIATNKRSFIRKAQWMRPDITILGAAPAILDQVSILRLQHSFPKVPLVIIQQGQALEREFPNAITDEIDNQILTGDLDDLLELIQAIILTDDPRSKMRGGLENEERRKQLQQQKSEEQSKRRAN